jgi:peptidoglycan hydrolase CwlO-like protein
MAKSKNKRNISSNSNKKEIEQSNNDPNTIEDELQQKQQELREREESLSKKIVDIDLKRQELNTAKEKIAQREKELNEKELLLKEKEFQAKNGFPKLFEEKFADVRQQLNEREQRITDEWKKIEAEKEKLRQRELTIQKAEIERDKGYADDRAKLDDELFNIRKNLKKELESKRANALNTIEKELSEERVSRIAGLEKEIADRLKAHKAAIQQDKDELEQKRKALLKHQADLDELKDELEYQKQRLQSRKERLDEREANLNNEIETLVAERKQSLENEKATLNDEIARLRESIKTSGSLISNFEELKQKLGNEDPAAVLLKLKTYEEEIKNLREDLATRPTLEMQKAFDRLKYEKEALESAFDRLSEENNQIRSQKRKQDALELEIEELRTKLDIVIKQKEILEAHNNQLQADLKRLQAAYEREEDREARIRDIETPYIQKELLRAELPDPNIKDQKNAEYELEWLGNISTSCIDYGLKFPRRILHAFHTALKTAEWSPITVLAGVSGTGKSELPRLYSHFGGINFLSLSVQPNWDSQESMLGFFNSIDNKFDAQPVLRLLAQTQKKKSEKYLFGLEDVMSLILMDEMNLAHVELYFAEFLSKLELRRGRKGSEVPSLEIKLGAGIPHYDLPLGRNVLWAGTMNQDETTKSLSDKVLDRGIVINFPRPTTLERRRQLKPLGDQAPLLSRKLWESWWSKESKFNDDQILPFKGFIEEMNTSLSKVGRALGHRVWQSIEYYMANYPDVLKAQRDNDDSSLAKAMKMAFEDQLVQKVMPKLRGIETRGKSKSDCLDKIRTQLVNDDYTIIEDFDLACEFGYGQFIWNSANYLKDDEPESDQEGGELINAGISEI